jgi:hypothetical protein
VEAKSQPSPVSTPPTIVTVRGPCVSINLPVNGMAMAKNARKNENGIRISFAVTACPRVSLK